MERCNTGILTYAVLTSIPVFQYSNIPRIRFKTNATKGKIISLSSRKTKIP
jgi:hypothetical protein